MMRAGVDDAGPNFVLLVDDQAFETLKRHQLDNIAVFT
jgi:hypothetical protein